MRLFTAVELDAGLRTTVWRAARELAQSLERSTPRFRARWTPEENLHITLVFLGETPEARLAALADALQPTFATRVFALGLTGFGRFPPSGAPRVLWLGVGKGHEALTALCGETAARFLPLGFEPERRKYFPHVTVARATDEAKADRAALRHALEARSGDVGSCTATHVTLFRSRLSPKGAAYEPVLRVPLKA